MKHPPKKNTAAFQERLEKTKAIDRRAIELMQSGIAYDDAYSQAFSEAEKTVRVMKAGSFA